MYAPDIQSKQSLNDKPMLRPLFPSLLVKAPCPGLVQRHGRSADPLAEVRIVLRRAAGLGTRATGQFSVVQRGQAAVAGVTRVHATLAYPSRRIAPQANPQI